MSRGARQVMADHLRFRRDGEFDRDLEENHHAEFIVLSARGAYRGHDGVRETGPSSDDHATRMPSLVDSDAN